MHWTYNVHFDIVKYISKNGTIDASFDRTLTLLPKNIEIYMDYLEVLIIVLYNNIDIEELYFSIDIIDIIPKMRVFRII